MRVSSKGRKEICSASLIRNVRMLGAPCALARDTEEKGLDIDFKAITFTTFGGFGEGTHELIKEVTKDTDWSLNDPWVKPNPKSHAYLTFGFALARANARMLLHADSRRRSAKNRVRTTRPQSATS